jgi:CBS-domain-containing membrane protein
MNEANDAAPRASAIAWLARAAGVPQLERPFLRDTALAGLGGFLAIAVLAGLGAIAAAPLIIAPFGASSVLLFSLPASPLAKPRNVIGGHVISALVGLLALAILGASPLSMAAGVGIAIVAMRLTGTTHPPAGANPIVVIAAGAPWWFAAVPVAAGAATLVVSAALYHRWVSGHSYP